MGKIAAFYDIDGTLYREGLIPCGLILPGGREPTRVELEYHNKYNLPFIITQEIETTIENPQMIFEREEEKIDMKVNKQLLDMQEKKINYNLFFHIMKLCVSSIKFVYDREEVKNMFKRFKCVIENKMKRNTKMSKDAI